MCLIPEILRFALDTVIVLGGLVFSHYAFANNPGCRETVFSIQNESSNDCVLKEYKILKGTLFDEFQVPDVILRGTTMAFTVTQGREKRESMGDYRFGTNASAMVYLSYQCGNDQSISMLSHLRPEVYCSIGGAPSIAEGFVLSKQNLDAKFSKLNPAICSAWSETRPAKINWVLADS